MANTKRTQGPDPKIDRQGHTASNSYGQNPDVKGKAAAHEKKRDLKP